MPTLRSGASTTITLPAGCSVVFDGNSAGSVSITSGRLAGQALSVGVEGGKLGPYDTTQTLSLSAQRDLSYMLYGSNGQPLGMCEGMVLLGDSHLQLQYNDFSFPGVLQGVSRKGYIYLANMMTGNRVRIVRNFGISGQRTDQILARVPQLIPMVRFEGVRHVVLDGDANDIAQLGTTDSFGRTITAQTIIANIMATVDQLRAIGIDGEIILQTGFPRAQPGGPASTAMSASAIAAHNEVNRWKRQFALTATKVRLLDLFPVLLDYTSPTTMSRCQPNTAWVDSEGLHINSFQATLQLARRTAALFQTLFPAVPNIFGGTHYDGTNGDAPNQFWKAPAGTSGAVGTGFTGTMPTNTRILRQSGDSTTTGTASVITREQMCTELGIAFDGVPGTVAKVTITAGASDGNAIIDNNWNTALLASTAIGKSLVLSGEVGARITSGGANDTLQGVYANMVGQSTNEHVFDDLRTDKWTSCKSFFATLQTARPWLVTSGESGFRINPCFGYQLSAGATADIYLSQPSCPAV